MFAVGQEKGRPENKQKSETTIPQDTLLADSDAPPASTLEFLLNNRVDLDDAPKIKLARFSIQLNRAGLLTTKTLPTDTISLHDMSEYKPVSTLESLIPTDFFKKKTDKLQDIGLIHTLGEAENVFPAFTSLIYEQSLDAEKLINRDELIASVRCTVFIPEESIALNLENTLDVTSEIADLTAQFDTLTHACMNDYLQKLLEETREQLQLRFKSITIQPMQMPMAQTLSSIEWNRAVIAPDLSFKIIPTIPPETPINRSTTTAQATKTEAKKSNKPPKKTVSWAVGIGEAAASELPPGQSVADQRDDDSRERAVRKERIKRYHQLKAVNPAVWDALDPTMKDNLCKKAGLEEFQHHGGSPIETAPAVSLEWNELTSMLADQAKVQAFQFGVTLAQDGHLCLRTMKNVEKGLAHALSACKEGRLSFVDATAPITSRGLEFVKDANPLTAEATYRRLLSYRRGEIHTSSSAYVRATAQPAQAEMIYEEAMYENIKSFKSKVLSKSYGMKLATGGHLLIGVSLCAAGYNIYTAEDKASEAARQVHQLGGGLMGGHLAASLGALALPALGVTGPVGATIVITAFMVGGAAVGSKLGEAVFDNAAAISRVINDLVEKTVMTFAKVAHELNFLSSAEAVEFSTAIERVKEAKRTKEAYQQGRLSDDDKAAYEHFLILHGREDEILPPPPSEPDHAREEAREAVRKAQEAELAERQQAYEEGRLEGEELENYETYLIQKKQREHDSAAAVAFGIAARLQDPAETAHIIINRAEQTFVANNFKGTKQQLAVEIAKQLRPRLRVQHLLLDHIVINDNGTYREVLHQGRYDPHHKKVVFDVAKSKSELAWHSQITQAHKNNQPELVRYFEKVVEIQKTQGIQSTEKIAPKVFRAIALEYGPQGPVTHLSAGDGVISHVSDYGNVNTGRGAGGLGEAIEHHDAYYYDPKKQTVQFKLKDPTKKTYEYLRDPNEVLLEVRQKYPAFKNVVSVKFAGNTLLVLGIAASIGQVAAAEPEQRPRVAINEITLWVGAAMAGVAAVALAPAAAPVAVGTGLLASVNAAAISAPGLAFFGSIAGYEIIKLLQGLQRNFNLPEESSHHIATGIAPNIYRMARDIADIKLGFQHSVQQAGDFINSLGLFDDLPLLEPFDRIPYKKAQKITQKGRVQFLEALSPQEKSAPSTVYDVYSTLKTTAESVTPALPDGQKNSNSLTPERIGNLLEKSRLSDQLNGHFKQQDASIIHEATSFIIPPVPAKNISDTDTAYYEKANNLLNQAETIQDDFQALDRLLKSLEALKKQHMEALKQEDRLHNYSFTEQDLSIRQRQQELIPHWKSLRDGQKRAQIAKGREQFIKGVHAGEAAKTNTPVAEPIPAKAPKPAPVQPVVPAPIPTPTPVQVQPCMRPNQHFIAHLWTQQATSNRFESILDRQRAAQNVSYQASKSSVNFLSPKYTYNMLAEKTSSIFAPSWLNPAKDFSDTRRYFEKRLLEQRIKDAQYDRHTHFTREIDLYDHIWRTMGYTTSFDYSDFKSALRSTGLESSYNGLVGYSRLSPLGRFLGQIGGVATKVGIIEGLENSLEQVLLDTPKFLFKMTDGEMPFSFNELQQVMRELAFGIFRPESSFPFFSLHFNHDATMYPVIPKEYENTLVGNIIAKLDFWMKSFLHGGTYSSAFLDAWPEHANTDPTFLKQNLIDMRKYCKQHNLDFDFHSLRELQYLLGLELGEDHDPDNMKANNAKGMKYQSSFRIIVKQNSFKKDVNSSVFLIDADFDVLYDMDLSPEYKEEIEAYKKQHGEYPKDYVLTRALYEKVAQSIHDDMPKMPFCKTYFQQLKVISFLCYYFNTLKSMGMAPQLPPMAKATEERVPKLFPHVPVRYFTVYPVKLTVGDLLQGEAQKDLLAWMTKRINGAVTPLPQPVKQSLIPLIDNHLRQRIPETAQADDPDRFTKALDNLAQGAEKVLVHTVTEMRKMLKEACNQLQNAWSLKTEPYTDKTLLQDDLKKLKADFEKKIADCTKLIARDPLLALAQEKEAAALRNAWLGTIESDCKKAIQEAVQELVKEMQTQMDAEIARANKESAEETKKIVAQLKREKITVIQSQIEEIKTRLGVQRQEIIDGLSQQKDAHIQQQLGSLPWWQQESSAAQEFKNKINQGYQAQVAEIQGHFEAKIVEITAKFTEDENKRIDAQIADVPKTLQTEHAQRVAEFKKQNQALLTKKRTEIQASQSKIIEEETKARVSKGLTALNALRLEEGNKQLTRLQDLVNDCSAHLQESSGLREMGVQIQFAHSSLEIADSAYHQKNPSGSHLVGGCGVRLPNQTLKEVHLNLSDRAIFDGPLNKLQKVRVGGQDFACFELPIENKPVLSQLDVADFATALQGDDAVEMISDHEMQVLQGEVVDFNPKAENPDGQILAHLTAHLNDVEGIKRCTQGNSEHLLHRDHFGRTVLHETATSNAVEAMVYCLEQRPELLEMQTTRGATALTIAAEKGSTEAVRCLVAHGANVNYVMPNGLFPLYLALQNENFETAKVLIEEAGERLNLDLTVDSGSSSLHLAVGLKQTDLALLMIARGAKTTLTRFADGYNALHIAVEEASYDVIKAILKQPNTPLTVNDVLPNGKTVLHLAVENHRFVVARMLIEQFKASVDPVSAESPSVLMIALKNFDLDLAAYLAKKMQPNTEAIQQGLWLAASLHQWVMCDVLVERGGDPVKCNEDGHSLMFYLLMAGQTKRYLALAKQFNLSFDQEFNGKSTKAIVAQQGHLDLLYEIRLKATFKLNNSTVDKAHSEEFRLALIQADDIGWYHTALRLYQEMNDREAETFIHQKVAYQAARFGAINCLNKALSYLTPQQLSNAYKGCHVLEGALISGKTEIIDHVLAHAPGAIHELLNKDTKDVAVEVAIRYGHVHLLSYLQQRGADIAIASAFQMVINRSDTDMFEELLRLVPLEQWLSNIVERVFATPFGSSDLTQYAGLRAVLKKACDWSKVSNEAKLKALFALCYQNTLEEAEYLLKQGVDLNQAIKRYSDISPAENLLNAAVAWDRPEFVALLIRYGADPSLSWHGRSAVELAVYCRSEQVLRLFERLPQTQSLLAESWQPDFTVSQWQQWDNLKHDLLEALLTGEQEAFAEKIKAFPLRERRDTERTNKDEIRQVLDCTLFEKNGKKQPLTHWAFELGSEWALEILKDQGRRSRYLDVDDEEGANSTLFHKWAMQPDEKAIEWRTWMKRYFLPDENYSIGYRLLNDKNSNGDTPLKLLLNHKKLFLLKELPGFDVTAKYHPETPEGYGWVHAAIFYNSLEFLEFLFERHFDLNVLNKKRQTPLMVAAAMGNLALVKWLVAHQADVDAVDIEGNSALHCALMAGKEAVALYLHALMRDVRLANRDGNTPFMLAAINNLAMILKVLHHTSEHNQFNHSGVNALHEAALAGHTAIIRRLVDYGFSVGEQTRQPLRTRKGLPGWTALQLAAQAKQKEAFQVLIQLGADPFKENLDKNIAVEYVAASSDEALVRSAFTIVADRVTDRESALWKNYLVKLWFATILSDCAAGLRELLLSGFIINTRDTETGGNGLHFAACNRNSQSANLLIAGGIDCHALDNAGNTPLHYAAQSQATTIVQRLGALGVDPNIPNNKHNTPLHMAAENGHLNMVLLLLKIGANFNLTNQEHATPFHVACVHKFFEVATLLVVLGDSQSLEQKAIQKLPERFRNVFQQEEGRLKAWRDGCGEAKRLHQTPLHLAARFFSPAAIRCLSKQHPNWLQQTDDHGDTPLDVAENTQSKAAPILKQMGGQ